VRKKYIRLKQYYCCKSPLEILARATSWLAR